MVRLPQAHLGKAVFKPGSPQPSLPSFGALLGITVLRRKVPVGPKEDELGTVVTQNNWLFLVCPLLSWTNWGNESTLEEDLTLLMIQSG